MPQVVASLSDCPSRVTLQAIVREKHFLERLCQLPLRASVPLSHVYDSVTSFDESFQDSHDSLMSYTCKPCYLGVSHHGLPEVSETAVPKIDDSPLLSLAKLATHNQLHLQRFFSFGRLGSFRKEFSEYCDLVESIAVVSS